MTFSPSIPLSPVGTPVFNSLFIAFGVVNIPNLIACKVNTESQVSVLSQNGFIPSP